MCRESKKPLYIVHAVSEIAEYDIQCLKHARMSLPRFRGLSEAWLYKEFNTAENVQQITLLEHRNLGRLSMGATIDDGPTEVGTHIHNELEQWYITLPGAEFTYFAEHDGEKDEIHVTEGDIKCSHLTVLTTAAYARRVRHSDMFGLNFVQTDIREIWHRQ